MLAKKRQDEILRMLAAAGAVTTSALVERFSVSVETVRRDLLTMEQAGLLRRVHGGAVTPVEMKHPTSLTTRNTEHHGEKRELALAATRLVSEGDYIAVDTGSTAILFSEALRDRFSRLCVVTYSADVFEILRDHRDFRVLLCGGRYLREERCFIGETAMAALSPLHVSRAFIFPTAVSLEGGICNHEEALVSLPRRMMQIADSVAILADSSKFETKAFFRLDEMRPEYRYVTDGKLPEGLRRLYAENGISIITGGSDL